MLVAPTIGVMRPDDDVSVMADDDVIAVPLDLVLHDRGGGGGGGFIAAVGSGVTPPSSATSPVVTSGCSDTGNMERKCADTTGTVLVL